jgi:hypothetical protein
MQKASEFRGFFHLLPKFVWNLKISISLKLKSTSFLSLLILEEIKFLLPPLDTTQMTMKLDVVVKKNVYVILSIKEGN